MDKMMSYIRIVLFFSLLFAAAYGDIKTKIVPDKFCLSIAMVSFLPLEPERIVGILIALPLLFAGVAMGGIGGGDIKLTGASGMVLGCWQGFIGLMFGLLYLILFHAGRSLVKKENWKGQAYPFVPFLFLGMLSSYFMIIILGG